jgi:hypothetical protein
MSSVRVCWSAAWTLRARRTLGASSASIRSIPGIQPTVLIAVRRAPMPMSGRRSQAASTLSTLMSGSPMPMNTAWSTSVLRRKWRAWSTISAVVRLRPNFIAPVAQNVHVSGQPDWLLRHSDRRPSR